MSRLIKNDSDLTRYKSAYAVIKEIEMSDEVKDGSRNSFQVVRNFLARTIADHLTA